MDNHEPKVIGALVQQMLEAGEESYDADTEAEKFRATGIYVSARKELREIHGYALDATRDLRFRQKSLGERMIQYRIDNPLVIGNQDTS